MKALILIHDDKAAWGALAPEAQQQIVAAYAVYAQRLAAEGRLLAAGQLAPGAAAKIVSHYGEHVVVRDGPYSDTREQLGWFFLIEAHDLVEATRLAQDCPGARHGLVEVRPLVGE